MCMANTNWSSGCLSVYFKPLQNIYSHVVGRHLVFSLILLLWKGTSTDEIISACSNDYKKSEKILSASNELQRKYNCTSYKYFIIAPPDHYIALNFSELFGFGVQHIPRRLGVHHQTASMSSHSQRHSDHRVDQYHHESLISGNCMPRLDVVEELDNGKEKSIVVICHEKNNYIAPQVFHSNMKVVIITYSWNPETDSHFELSFMFYKKTCPYKCGDGSCLQNSLLVCNGAGDCYDESDEVSCPVAAVQSVEKNSGVNKNIVGVLVIVVAFLILLLIVICVFCNYRLSNSRNNGLQLHHQHQHDVSDSSERNQIQVPSPAVVEHRNQEVVYVPQTGHTNSRLHQPQAHRHMSNSSHDVDSDTTNLPPQICISLDGEEGYVNSQHKLQQPSIVSQEMVNPPPNRTVFQGEEIPPPYRAYSVGQLDKSKLMSSGRPKAGRDCTSSPCVPYSHPHYCSAAAAAAFYSCSHSGINNNNISNCNKKLCLNNNGNNNGFTHNGHPSPSIPPTLPKQQQQKKQRQQSSRSEGEQYSSSYSKTAGSLLDSSYQKQLKFDLQDQLQQPLTTCNHNTHHPPSNPRSACLYSAAPPVGQDRRSHQRYPTQQPHNHHHQHQQRNNRTVSGSTSSGNSSSNTAGLPSYSSNSPPYDCTELSDTDVFCSDVNSGDIVHSTGGVVATGVSELRPSPDAS